MFTVQMTGKTQKGKNRVREHGTLWNCIEVRDSVRFDTRVGGWLRVTPSNGNTNAERWVRQEDDVDFAVIL